MFNLEHLLGRKLEEEEGEDNGLEENSRDGQVWEIAKHDSELKALFTSQINNNL